MYPYCPFAAAFAGRPVVRMLLLLHESSAANAALL